MKKKKVIAVLLACAMTASLAACGSTDKGSASGTASGGADAAATGISQEVDPNYVGTLIPTFAKRTGDSYTIGLYVQGNEVVNDYSYMQDYATVADDGVSINDLSVNAEGSGFSAIVVQRTEDDKASTVNINNTDITLTDSEDGTNVSDFTGLGSAIVASGASEADHIKLNIDNLNLTTTGFERDGIIVDDYADAIVTNSNIVANGANPLSGEDSYDGYISTANQSYMLSPPWVLGIAGGARAANVLGDYSSLTVVDSTVEAGAWAVLSTDDCTEPTVNVVNSELKIAGADTEYGMNGGADLFGYATKYGSGYGTYSIGSANEYFYGTTFTGTTYATIMTGTGETYYGASSDGLTVNDGLKKGLYTYSGEAKDTVVNSVFGIMNHQGGEATLDAGSVWNTEDATILNKVGGMSGDVAFTISGAEINSATGVIFQQMDDDDGYGTEANDGGSQTTYDGTAWGMPSFSGGWYEVAGKAGLPSDVGTLAKGGEATSTLNITAGEYTGDIFNGTGSGAEQDGKGLAVNLSGTTINGAISSTEAIHGIPYTAEAVAYLDDLAAKYGDGVALQGEAGGANGDGTYSVKYELLDANGAVTEDAEKAAYIQFMEFTVNEYYMLGHMLNFAADGASVEVNVAKDATWNVTKDSYVSYLNIEDGGTVTVADGAKLYVAGKEYTGTVEAGTYGAQYVAPEGGDEGGMGMPGGPGMEGAASGDATPAPTLDTSHKVNLTVSKK